MDSELVGSNSIAVIPLSTNDLSDDVDLDAAKTLCPIDVRTNLCIFFVANL